MKLFNYDSPFWSFMSRLADLIILNLLWIVFCVPVVTIGASTTAMYRVTLNMVRGEGSGVVRMFWDAFRLNLKQAVLIFLILLIPVLLVVSFRRGRAVDVAGAGVLLPVAHFGAGARLRLSPARAV